MALTAGAYVIEWDKIIHWTGEGSNHAALVIQFNTRPGQSNPGALVWGYRWSEGTPTCEQMIEDIARAGNDLTILQQFTGEYGSTFAGAGYAPDVKEMIPHLAYDFDSASADENISFGFFSPNTVMNQTSAPGGETADLIAMAIEGAVNTHVIEHPLNQHVYGYPAYDYDWWQLDTSALANNIYYWNAGWYKGYWSYWLGTGDFDNMNYSGTGMSSTEVWNGDVHAWRYQSLSDDSRRVVADATTGATEQWLEPNYTHFSGQTGVNNISSTNDNSIHVYSLDGNPVLTATAGEHLKLSPGIYIVRRGNAMTKILVK